MKSFLFKNALLAEGWQKNIHVECREGIFKRVEVNSAPKSADKIFDCVIPTMPNSHSHVFQRSMAGLTEYKTADNDSFWSWRDLMYKYANQIDSTQLYHIARYTYSEMLKAGYSSVCEFHYVHRDLSNPSDTLSMSKSILNAANDVGISLTFLPVLYTQSHMNGSKLDSLQKRFELSVEEYIELYSQLQSELFEGQKLGICFHSLRAVSLQQMKKVLKAIGVNQPIHLHISEQQAEIEQCLNVFEKRPVEYLFENFDVDENWSLIHATHLNSNEIEMIAKSNATVGICPLTEANLGDGVFPLVEYKQHNGSFSIGSDSHIAINPFLELQTLEYSQRLTRQQRIIASDKNSPHVGSYLWNQSVQGGAKASHLKVNGIRVGEKANWIVLDTEHPLSCNMKPEELLDTCLFVDSGLAKNCFFNGQSYGGISSEIIENYKNTLIQLR